MRLQIDTRKATLIRAAKLGDRAGPLFLIDTADVRDPRHVWKTPCARTGGTKKKALQTPHTGGGVGPGSKKAKSRKVWDIMHVCSVGESDCSVVPTKRAGTSDAYALAAEFAEGRGRPQRGERDHRPKGEGASVPRTQSRGSENHR